MNPESDVKFISERRILSLRAKLLLVAWTIGILVSGTLGGYWYYLNYVVVPPAPPLENVGLEEQVSTDISPAGELYFTAVVKDGENLAPHIFKHSFEDKSEGVEIPFPARSYSRSTGELATMIALVPGSVDPDGWQPAWSDVENDDEGTLPHGNGYNENELTISPDDIHYAYVYQTSDNKSSTNISDWNIALYNFDTSEVITIEGATEPAFVRDRTELYYMKSDGIYAYSLASSTHTLISPLYANLSTIDDMAVTQNGKTIVFTSPTLDLISVQSLTPGEEVNELGRLVSNEAKYRHPVISPDGQWYAVLAARKDGAGQYNNVTAEIRGISSRTITATLTFPDLIPSSLQLNEWHDATLEIQDSLLID